MNSLIKKIMSPFIKKEIPKPVGRLTLNNKTFFYYNYFLYKIKNRDYP